MLGWLVSAIVELAILGSANIAKAGAMIFKGLRPTLAIVCVCLATQAQAVSIASLPGLSSITFWEESSLPACSPCDFTFAFDSAEITTRLSDPLSGTNRDFSGTGGEYYDVFYSESNGTFSASGAFISIEAVFDNPNDSALNISAVSLNFDNGTKEYASSVASTLTFALAFPATFANALGSDLDTYTLMGNTAGVDGRMRLTLGFESSTVVPIPATLPLFASGLGALGLLGWRRKRKAQTA